MTDTCLHDVSADTVFLFSTAEWMSSRLSHLGRHSEACIAYIYTVWKCHWKYNQSDLKNFIFCRPIYIILIYLLQKRYFDNCRAQIRTFQDAMRL